MDFDSHLHRASSTRLKAEGNYRIFADLERQCGAFPRAANHRGDAAREVTVWCSNDYLGMGQHPDGRGARWSRRCRPAAPAPAAPATSRGNNHAPPARWRRELADLHGKEAALLFTSGYVSNWAALSTLGARIPNAVILSDARQPRHHDRRHPPFPRRQGDLEAQRLARP